MSALPTLPPSARAGNGLAEGERCRDVAHARLHARRPVLIRRVQRALLRHLLDRGPATSDAVRALVPIPAGTDPRVVGAAVRALATARLITAVGRERSRRPEAHARWLDLWTIPDRAEAAAWLACHADAPDPLPLYPDID